MQIRSRRALIDGTLQPAAIRIEHGVIREILPFETSNVPETEGAILPGLVCGSTAMRVKALLTPEILIEIQAVAAL